MRLLLFTKLHTHMRPLSMIHISLLLASGVMAQQPVPVEYLTPTKTLQKFVSYELGWGKATIRWSALPQLKVTSSDPGLRKFVELTFAAICQNTGMTEVGEGIFHVFIGSQADFLKLDVVRANTISFKPGNWWWSWNGDHSLKQTLVMASYNEETDASTNPVKLQVAANMKKMFGLGMRNRNDRLINAKEPVVEVPIGLSPLDKMLIKFSYQHVPPGTEAGALPRLLRLYWNK
jgi:hypothetical protein